MRLKIKHSNQCSTTFVQIERELNKLSKYVMENKKFEKKMFFAVLIIYCYIGFQAAYWFGRTVLKWLIGSL